MPTLSLEPWTSNSLNVNALEFTADTSRPGEKPESMLAEDTWTDELPEDTSKMVHQWFRPFLFVRWQPAQLSVLQMNRQSAQIIENIQ